MNKIDSSFTKIDIFTFTLYVKKSGRYLWKSTNIGLRTYPCVSLRYWVGVQPTVCLK